MKQRIFSHFQDYLIQYISHQYQDLLYCNSSQYILSTICVHPITWLPKYDQRYHKNERQRKHEHYNSRDS